jgi:deoxyribodipyrimidine photo-lyase
MTGGRLNRFNIVKQSKDYDQNVPTQYIHEPWKMNDLHQIEYNVRLGVDYPNPIVPPSSGGTSSRATNNNDNDSNNNKYSSKSTNRSNKQQQQGKQRKPNQNRINTGQKYEMKS